MTLCLPVDFQAQKVLLGMKKRGFGAGRWNGFGGKVKEGETLEAAVSRELFEESGLSAQKTEKIAELDFFFPHKPEFNQTVNVFFATRWQGDATESEEMMPKWFAFGEIPFAQMWSDDSHWLPRVLKGEKLKGKFVFTPEEKVASAELIQLE